MRIRHGRKQQLIDFIRTNAQSANGKRVQDITASERNALNLIVLFQNGLVNDDGEVEVNLSDITRFRNG